MQILIKPIVTEKLNEQGEKLNSFGFVVNKNANKLQIKQAIEEMYDVTVDRVNTMVYAGKVKSRHTKSGVQVGKTAAYKKAIVTLVPGDKIDFYSNI
ncbi:LSU ribosomal protein L23P [Saccharicrinis carchari]|uniref:Large ribosomal subunit protein uL23 n=1 Tax=Saccharicrinis carchari TaxID=1168039 RepID=A0A521EUT7_SACCC|nr:50S ribosomal protein L23 [Saccharicrinis carchari]SMO87718.1 LSU ribosomal protein L23P [Saccharicrinis carchari]